MLCDYFFGKVFLETTALAYNIANQLKKHLLPIKRQRNIVDNVIFLIS